MLWELGTLAALLVPGNGTACHHTHPCPSAGTPTCDAQQKLFEYAVDFITNPKLQAVAFPARQPTHTFVVDVTTVAFDIDILEVRMYEMAPFVDLFVVAESDKTDRCAPKPYYVERHAHRFKPLGARFVYLRHRATCTPKCAESTPLVRDNWSNENSPRRAAMAHAREIIKAIKPKVPAVIIAGDADEFFARSSLPNIIADVHASRATADVVCPEAVINFRGSRHITSKRLKLRGQVPTASADGRFHMCTRPSKNTLGFNIAAMFNCYAALIKAVMAAEGGGVPRRHIDAIDFVQHPHKCAPFKAQGIRMCCNDRPVSTDRSAPKDHRPHLYRDYPNRTEHT